MAWYALDPFFMSLDVGELPIGSSKLSQNCLGLMINMNIISMLFLSVFGWRGLKFSMCAAVFHFLLLHGRIHHDSNMSFGILIYKISWGSVKWCFCSHFLHEKMDMFVSMCVSHRPDDLGGKTSQGHIIVNETGSGCGSGIGV